MVTAMKQKEVERLNTLRMIKAALLNRQKESAGGSDELSDDAVIEVLQKEAKKRKESIAAFTDAGRNELAATEQSELAVIEGYLPAAMSPDEIRQIVEQVVASMDAPNFGAVMGATMKEVGSRADGNDVRAVVQEVLG